jgi:predicted Fe-S protein YdhL (DUF1289 family)
VALTNRPPEVRERLLKKVEEYAALSPEARELRLRATELRWYLVAQMKLPLAQRPPLETSVPADLRKLVADRLQQWDLLPPDAQRELLDNELALDYFSQVQSADATPPQQLLENLSPAQQQRVEADIARWQSMPAAERERLFERVRHFFELTPKEQQKALASVSAAERAQIDETLRAFRDLPREQRGQCIRSFAKFAGMGAAERQQFLQNAERWGEMSPTERQAWRDLVRKLPLTPPLPPGLTTSLLPPLPPARPPLPAANPP